MQKKHFILFFLLFVYSNLFSQTFQLYNGDTINYTDVNDLKQGKWIFFNENYQNSIIQQGEYVDNKKEKIWDSYYSNGTLKSSVTFRNNSHYGYTKFYNEKGILIEEGEWRGNRWVGRYKYYYEDGKPNYIWNFNNQGKRTGNQQYYYENGELQIEGTWQEGKEQGLIKEYYTNGTIKKETEWETGKYHGATKEYYTTGQLKYNKKFENGKLDESSIVYYALNNDNPQDNNTDNSENNENNDNETTHPTTFTGTGFHKLFNANQLPTMEGHFKNGVLMNGKKYFYDLENNLIKTEILEDGRIIETIIEKND